MGNYLDRLKFVNDRSYGSLVMTMRMQLKVMGTEVIIETMDKESEHRKAFGNMFQTDDFQTAPREIRTGRFIIDRNVLGDYHSKQSVPLTLYHYDDLLKTGDTVSFRQSNIRYRFKVTDKYTYGLNPSIIFRYDLVGLPEDTDVLQLKHS